MKIYSGKVISKKMTKTATVAVERVVVHLVYKKRFKRIKKYHVHDLVGVEIGQLVRFVESKPISKLKKWTILDIIEKKDNKKRKSAGSQKKSQKTGK